MQSEQTGIPGLIVLRHDVQRTDSGWFKENWHAEKLSQLGIHDFRPVQHNVTQVAMRGITRGFHAEPWDRMISVVSGRAFGAWVDLRPGAGFGRVYSRELDLATSVLVPNGVANAHQVLEDGTIFSYLLADHWTPTARERSTFVNLFDPVLGVKWPLPRESAIVSELDLQHPTLAEAFPPVVKERPRPVPVKPAGPYRVMFVCTANICRSAYADVVANGLVLPGVQFSSAGVQALVGEPIEELMGQQVRGRGDLSSHRARQLTRAMMEEADLVLAMTSRHRRWILDEWPALAPKTFIIGQVARGIAAVPDEVTLPELRSYLWQHRDADPNDEVSDPYGRGPEVAATTAEVIDRHLAAIAGGLRRLTTGLAGN